MKMATPWKTLAVEMHMKASSIRQRTVQAVEDGVTLVIQWGEMKLGFRVMGLFICRNTL